MSEARRVGLVLVSFILIVIGAMLTPTPLPVGAILIGIGLGMLLANSRRAKVWTVLLMRRYPSLRQWRTRFRHLLQRYMGQKQTQR